MASPTSIANMALGHLGIQKKIANISTDSDASARAVREFYDISLEQTLRDFSWPFAQSIEALALHSTDPNPEWRFAYQYPTDCLNFMRVLGASRNPTRYGRVSHKIINAGGAKRILCDQPGAWCEYTLNVVDPALYTPDFMMALSLRLASNMATQLCGTNALKMKQSTMQQYMYEIEMAKATARNEEQVDVEPDSEFILVRNGSIGGNFPQDF